jgi:hypothetical protein
MFGFSKNRKYRKAARNLGVLIHQQILDALLKHQYLFNTPRKTAFTSGYLKSFFWGALSRRGCNDIGLQLTLLKDTCNKIAPDRLWDIYVKGEALTEFGKGKPKEQYIEACEAYELGITAGLNDAEQISIHKATPVNLMRFLMDKNLVGPAFMDSDLLQFKINPAPVEENLDEMSNARLREPG